MAPEVGGGLVRAAGRGGGGVSGYADVDRRPHGHRLRPAVRRAALEWAGRGGRGLEGIVVGWTVGRGGRGREGVD